MLRLPAILICVALLAACATPPDNDARRGEAADLAARYLDAVSGGAEDRGWSLLHPEARDAWDSEAAYVEEAARSDWTAFEVRVLETASCDDGTWCQVTLEIPSGPTSVPPMLHARENALEVGIRFHGLPELPGDGEIRVTLTDFLRPHGVGWPPAG